MQISRILVPVDPAKEPGPSLHQAAHLAETCEATLVCLVIGKNEALYDRIVQGVDELPATIQSYLRNNLPDPDHAEYRFASGQDLSDDVLDHSQAGDVDMIVVDSHLRRKLGWMLLDSLSQEVIRAAHRPVLSVRPHARKETKKILAPVDFSDANEAALAYAALMAQSTGAALDVLHVVEDIKVPGLYVSMTNPMLEFSAELRDHIQNGMTELMTHLPEDISTDLHIRRGNAASEIVDYAKEHDVDLIVLSSHGLTAVERFFLGSVADRILQLAECPVLLIPSINPPVD